MLERKLDDRLRVYTLFLEWLEANSQYILSMAYAKFKEETGLEV